MLHYLSERDGKWVIRKRGGVGKSSFDISSEEAMQRLLGGLEEDAGHASWLSRG